ncbi:MAG: aldehyde ferredoxin oxidoreductase N-terminal domain-containing protein, partial [Chloroflexota bacterium]
MDGLYGWTGKLLRVDLTRGVTWTEDTAQYVPQFVGGMGVAAKIAWDELKSGVDAFDPENMLFLMVGPLTGTLASGASRVLVAGVAPQQRPSVFSRSGMGGHWGAEIKYSGYDGIVIQGKSEKPVYLWVHDGEVEIRDASDLWGVGTYGVTNTLRGRHGPKTRIIACGQAGERRSRIACIQSETGNAAGQGGFGGLMGSKNLKAIAAHGTLGVRVADPKRLLDLCLHGSREGAGPNIAGGRGWRMQIPENIQSRNRKCGYCATP